MRTLILFLMVTLSIPALAQRHFDGSLLSFQQLIHLTPAKRLQYLNELRLLLVDLEKQESELLDVADEDSARALHGKIASLIQLMSIVPQAMAENEGQGDTTNESAETNETPAPSPAPAAAQPALDASAGDSCAPPVSSCNDPLTPAETKAQKKAKASFWKSKDPADNVCIAGGFFSSYASSKKKTPGTCAILHKYPADSRTPDFTCPTGSALCNPLLYCAVDTSGTAVTLDYHCETFGPHNTNLTERCEQWYAGVAQAAKQGTVRLCDATNTKGLSLADNWEKVRSALQAKYQKWCIDQGDIHAGMQALFCHECESMGRVFTMNMAAVGQGCGPADAAPAAATPDTSKVVQPTTSDTQPQATAIQPAAQVPVKKATAPTSGGPTEAHFITKMQVCLGCHKPGARTDLTPQIKAGKLMSMGLLLNTPGVIDGLGTTLKVHLSKRLGASEYSKLMGYLKSGK